MTTNGPFDNCDNLFHEDVTIAANASNASPFFTAGSAIVGIFMPAAWTDAKIGMEASPDGINWYTAKNITLEQATVEASIFIPIPIPEAIFAPYIRLKSVDAANAAVNQTAARTLTLVTKRYLGGSS